MKSIVVPTDFSKIAENAFDYASGLAEHWDSSIKVINVVHPTVGTEDGITIPSMEALVGVAEEQMNEFVEGKYDSDAGTVSVNPKVSEEILIGFAADELVRLSGKDDVDLLLMGTTGEGGKGLEKIFGTVSSAVARKAHCPVLLVPPRASFKGYKKIMYASNYESADKTMLSAIIDFAKSFDASIDLVHVDSSAKPEDYDFEELLVQQLFKKIADESEINMYTIKGDLTWKSLNNYATENDVDLIVLLTRHRSFWDNLFHKSLTKEMVAHAEIPLLIYHAA